MHTINARKPLRLEELKKQAPSVYAVKPSSKMGERYTFIPSSTVVEGLHKMGLVPVHASQRRSHDATSARHLIRFARVADLQAQPSARKVGDVTPEVVFSNSHNGRCRAQLFLGLFRLVCSNGLVVSDKTFVHMARRHTGSLVDIMHEVEEVLGQTKKVMAHITNMQRTTLAPTARLAFAAKALELRYADEDGKVNAPITAEALLVPRRPADEGNDLWRTFNVVQENMLRGGVAGRSANGRVVHTREVQDVRKVLTYNTDLWDLAAERIAA